MKSTPLCSVVMPIYNSSEFVSVSIRSVLAQTCQDWEVILVDDCSTDSSVDVAEAFAAQDFRIRLIRLPENSGAAVARNTAIEAARGRYIAFLDSDDLWLPYKLETQLAFMKERDVAFSYAAYEKIDEDGRFSGLMGVPDRVGYGQLLKGSVIGCLTAMYDTHKLGKVYMPLIRKRQDFGLWLRLLKETEFAYGIHEPLAQYRLRAGSVSSNKANAAYYTWRLYRDIERLGILKSSYYFAHYAARGVLRQKLPWLAKRFGVLD